MIYYANPTGLAVCDAMSAGRLGCITTPAQGNVTFPDEWDVIADNGCFSNRWTPTKWWRWLLDLPRTIRFAVCPDVFDPTGQPCHDQTLERWNEWGLRIELAGFQPAFVCQVGATPDNVPDAPVLFLGGTTEWKLGSTAEAITRTAKDAGKWVHMGRVNSEKRLRRAREMGCDSCDGTFLVFGPDINLRRLTGWLDRADSAPMLWETT